MLFKSFKKQQKKVEEQCKWIYIFLSSWKIKDMNYLEFCIVFKVIFICDFKLMIYNFGIFI